MRRFLSLALPLLATPALAAGNVTVLVDSDGDVVVTGDASSNNVILEAESDLAIRGLNGTTINGGTEAFFLAPVRGRYRIDLGGGDDRFETSTVMRPGSEVFTGPGDDHVGIGNSGAGGRGLTIDTGAGDDFVDIQDSSFSLLRILTGDGADDVQFVFAFTNACLVRTGADDDFLRLFESTFTGPVTFFGGDGSDEIEEDAVEFVGPQPKIVSFEVAVSVKS